MSLLRLILPLLLASPDDPFRVSVRDGVSTEPDIHFDAAGLRLASKTIPMADVVSIRRHKQPLPGRLAKACLFLPLGNRWSVDVRKPIRIEEDTLFFTPGFGEEVGVSVAYVSMLWWEAPTQQAEKFFEREQHVVRSRDRVWLRGGEVLDGTVVGLDPKTGLRLQVNGQERTFPTNRLMGLAFNSELRAKPRVRGPYWHAVLADGSRVSLASIQSDADRWVAKATLGPQFRLDPAQVRGLDVYKGCSEFLSDLPPSTAEIVPFLRTSWPWQKDVSVRGEPLQLGLATFDKGLGTHAKTKLVYELDQHLRFEGQVGLDPQHGLQGRVRVVIQVDDKIYLDRHLTAADEAVPFDVDLRGGRRLALFVHFTDQGDVGAHVNWGDARIVRR